MIVNSVDLFLDEMNKGEKFYYLATDNTLVPIDQGSLRFILTSDNPKKYIKIYGFKSLYASSAEVTKVSDLTNAIKLEI